MSYRIYYTWYPRELEGYSDYNGISNANEMNAHVDIFSLLVVALFSRNLASRPS
jgi:hypothetical protein